METSQPELMSATSQPIAELIANAAISSQKERTGHAPKSVQVVINGNTLVITLQGALTPAEQALARSPEGIAKIQEFHRELFLNSSNTLRNEIKRITGLNVKGATTEVNPKTGEVVQVFDGGTMVQVFLLSGDSLPGNFNSEPRSSTRASS